MEKDPKKCKPCLSPNSSTLLGVEVDSDEREEVKDNNDEDDEFAELLEAFVAEAEEAEKKQSLIKVEINLRFSYVHKFILLILETGRKFFFLRRYYTFGLLQSHSPRLVWAYT